MGYADPAFTLACYGHDHRDTETMVADVRERAAADRTELQPPYRSRRGERERQTFSEKAR